MGAHAPGIPSTPSLILAARMAVDETRSFGLLREHLDSTTRPQAEQPEIPPQVVALLEQRVAELLKEREHTYRVRTEPAD